ncbi:hypothetical protein HK104_006438 [Borealophlyctis nickersoniae]|nr:hypothetical protein HK104_006438 [Borealophlyctis nickersoniae]
MVHVLPHFTNESESESESELLDFKSDTIPEPSVPTVANTGSTVTAPRDKGKKRAVMNGTGRSSSVRATKRKRSNTVTNEKAPRDKGKKRAVTNGTGSCTLLNLLTSHKELQLGYGDLFNELRNGGLSTNQVIEQFENFQRKYQELVDERGAGALLGGHWHTFITSHKKLQLVYVDLFNEWRNGGLSTNQVIEEFENFQRKYQELVERVVAAVLGDEGI